MVETFLIPLPQGSTRILVTHQRQFLPQCDRVMVMRSGSIVALGSWAQISALQLPELTAGMSTECQIVCVFSILS